MMRDDQVERHQLQNRLEGMSDDQVQRQRERFMPMNLTPAQLRQRRRSSVEAHRRLAVRPVKVAQEWDWDHACAGCEFVWLKSIAKQSRHLCCRNGRAFE